MIRRLPAIAAILLLLPFFSQAQRSREDKRRKPVKVVPAERPAPKWAEAHSYNNDKYVYFPDYYLFYSPVRGYVYWSNNAWTTSQAMPAYVNEMTLIGARAEMLDRVPVTGAPEREFKNYYKQYPAEPAPRSGIPVPRLE